MSTNYYVVKNGPSCQPPVHIGKYSCGWLFCFQVQNDFDIDPPIVWYNYRHVKDWLRENTGETKPYVIIDEYDGIISYDTFTRMVELTQTDPDALSNKENFMHRVENVGGYRFLEGEFY